MRTLVIGYGNPSRQDDGVGLAVVNGLRARAGRTLLEEGEDGFDELGQALDTLFLQQLSPELAETLADYDHLVLVDAHLGGSPGLVHRTELDPRAEAAIVSHHFRPGTMLRFDAPAIRPGAFSGIGFRARLRLRLHIRDVARDGRGRGPGDRRPLDPFRQLLIVSSSSSSICGRYIIWPASEFNIDALAARGNGSEGRGNGHSQGRHASDHHVRPVDAGRRLHRGRRVLLDDRGCRARPACCPTASSA